MRRALVGLLAVLVAVVVLAGCSAKADPPGESDIDVATPELVEMKQVAAIEDCAPGDGEPGGNGLPELTLPCLGGGPDVDLSALSGPLVINLWASNCVACVEEMPALQAFHEQYGDQVPVLGIDWVDTLPRAAIQLARETGATYPQLADPGGTLLDQQTLPLGMGNPQFVIVDASGAVVHQQAGGLDSEQEVVDMVEGALGITL